MKIESEQIIEKLAEMYPTAGPELDFKNPYELLIAAILSAQCTDKRVNEVTSTLFVDYPNAESLAKADLSEVEEKIKTCGLYHSKAKSITGAAKIMVEQYGGEVPKTMDELMKMPGVGRKVANVVLYNAYGIPAIAVDTHVFRVSNRIGLASASTPEATEKQLMNAIKPEMWGIAHHLLIFHGRRICSARKPKCDECKINGLCAEYNKTMKQ